MMGQDHTRDRPTGTVSFLFTDIEGSTPLWEQHPDAMRAALERHDAILREAIEAHGGFVFSTAGDAFSAAFHTPGDAIGATLDAQRQLQAEPWPDDAPVKVRMGVHLGTVQERDGDYFGSVVNRAARLMGIAHGGQVVVSLVVEEAIRDDLSDGVGLKGLGEHALKGLSRPESVFQLTAPDLAGEFPVLAAATSVPGNLPVPPTSFVGRDVEVAELSELVRAHRLVTLTGVGGVGKTRLAIQVAAEVAGEFGDGVWLIELAPVGDPAAVPDAVATSLGITPQPDLTVTASVARALSGRPLLIVLDNCEHVLDAAADLVETVLAGTDSVKVVATSREGLRVGAEQLWSVPSLDVGAGVGSPAVALFVERARSVNVAFELSDTADVEAVTEICRRLDGIALGIELAAARMVSMSAQDIRDRLDDRFRLLAGSRRGLERHQTLRHAVGWSFELLDDDERAVLCRCAVFAAGFDLAAAAHLCADTGSDEYAVLDVLDSLVRKSLITIEQVGGHARYAMLETIRQYAEDQLAEVGDLPGVRDRHAAYFADQAQAYWQVWDSVDQRSALDWVDAEFANLRSGFRWASDRGAVGVGVAIAAHVALMCWSLQRFEPAGWAEELLEAATLKDLDQLPRLYAAASLCMFSERAGPAVGYAQTAVALEREHRYDPFEDGWSSVIEAGVHMVNGRLDIWVEICEDLTARTGFARVAGLCGLLYALPAVGRVDEARAIADETIEVARAHGNPFWIAFALAGQGRPFTATDPDRALDATRHALTYARENRLAFWETTAARDAARLEAAHGDLGQALALFDTAIELLHRSGNIAHFVPALVYLAVLFDRTGRHDITATLYGASTHDPSVRPMNNLVEVLDRSRRALGEAVFDRCVADGAVMNFAEAVRYARDQIQIARSQLPAPT